MRKLYCICDAGQRTQSGICGLTVPLLSSGPPSGPHLSPAASCLPISSSLLGLPLSMAQEICLPKPAGAGPHDRYSVVPFSSLATCFLSSTSPQVGSLILSWTNYSYFYLSVLIPERLINCLVAWKQLLPWLTFSAWAHVTLRSGNHRFSSRSLSPGHVQLSLAQIGQKLAPLPPCLGIWEKSLICQMVGYCVCIKC